jgi:predicted RecA/RadA family phage recombinase
MARPFVQPRNTIDAIAPGLGGIFTGVPLLTGNLFGIPEITAALGQTFALNLVGVHRVPKVPAHRSRARSPTGRRRLATLPEQKNISDADKKGCRIIASFS